MKLRRTLRRGDSILEIIIASALIVIGLVSILSLATRSQKTSDFSRDNNHATNYSYEANDWLRDMRNILGFDTLAYYLSEDSLANDTTYCLNSTLPTTEIDFEALDYGECASGDTITDSVFYREISLDLSTLASDYITGIITTSWEGNTTHTNILEIKLTKWQ